MPMKSTLVTAWFLLSLLSEQPATLRCTKDGRNGGGDGTGTHPKTPALNNLRDAHGMSGMLQEDVSSFSAR